MVGENGRSPPAVNMANGIGAVGAERLKTDSIRCSIQKRSLRRGSFGAATARRQRLPLANISSSYRCDRDGLPPCFSLHTMQCRSCLMER